MKYTRVPTVKTRQAPATARATYRPIARQEEFIVPLVGGLIEQGLAMHAVHAPPGAEAIDVGCGRQPFRGRLEQLGYRYTGMDAAQNADGIVDVIAAIDAPLPTELASRQPFHFVLCTEVMEHVADWAQAFRNLSQLARPGGKILLTCPQFYPLHEEPYDFWRPTPYAIRTYAERSGLRVLEQKAAGDAWDVMGTLFACCAAVPAGRGPVDRLVRECVRIGKKAVFELLRRRFLQRHVTMVGPIYLSNYVVLEKRATPDASSEAVDPL